MKQILIILFLLVVVILLVLLSHLSYFRVRSVDAMSWTQDRVMPESQPTDQFITEFVELSRALPVTHIAISVPYDDPPETAPGTALAFATRWVKAIRAEGEGKQPLHVWFRSSPIEYKNFYHAGIKRDKEAHVRTITQYILHNPGLFKEGDIFTPIPEPQAGTVKGINCEEGCIFENREEFVSWLIHLKAEVEQAFAEIGLKDKVVVGRWGFDGFSVWGDRNPEWEGKPDVLATGKELIESDGGYVCIDHYFGQDDPEQEFHKIQAFFPRAKMWLCEWGATENQSKEYTEALMKAALRHGITGFNYWQAGPAGPESLFYLDDSGHLHTTSHYEVVKKYFNGWNLVW